MAQYSYIYARLINVIMEFYDIEPSIISPFEKETVDALRFLEIYE